MLGDCKIVDKFLITLGLIRDHQNGRLLGLLHVGNNIVGSSIPD